MLMAATALAVLLSAVIVTRSFEIFSFNHDVAWILHCADRMLDGEQLYRDIVEENPPLIFWLSMIPAAVARWLGVQPILVFNVMLGAVVGVSCLLAYRVHQLAFSAVSASYRLALVALVASLEVLAPGYEFGQRENILLIAVLPYVFAAAACAGGRSLPRRLSVAVGLLAGVGFALKPYFLLLWLAMEAWLWARTRVSWRRTENLTIAGVLLLYALVVVVCSSAYFEMVALAMDTYSAYGVFGSPALLLHVSVAVVVAAAVLFLVVSPRDFDRELRTALFISTLALLGCALLQGKGWDYHYDPATASAVVLSGVILLGLGAANQERLQGRVRRVVLGFPLVMVLAMSTWGAATLGQLGWWVWGPPSEQRTVLSELVDAVRSHAWSQPIWLMSTSVVPAFPVVNLSEARWSSRFCCLWLLPGLYTEEEKATRPFPYHERGDMTPTELYLGDAVVEDLAKNPPTLLIVDRSPEKQAFRRTDFDFLRYFLRDARFAAFFANYEAMVDIGPFRVYQRKQLEGISPVGDRRVERNPL